MFSILYFIYLLYLYYTITILLHNRIQTHIIYKYTLFDSIKYSILFLIFIYTIYITDYITNNNIIIKNINEIDCILSIIIYFYIDKIWYDYIMILNNNNNQNNQNNTWYNNNQINKINNTEYKQYYLYTLYYITILNIICKIIL